MSVLTEKEAVRALEQLLADGPQEETVLQSAYSELVDIRLDAGLWEMWKREEIEVCLKNGELAWKLPGAESVRANGG